MEHMQAFESRVYVYRAKHNGDGKFDSQAVKYRMVGFCKGYAYRVFLDDDLKVDETTDVKVCEGDGIVSDGAGEENDATDLGMPNENIIFDD